jgi:DNA mismatch repair protein MLH1
MTFGFRGEALASISLCAKVTVTSKTPCSEVAYIANFTDGLMDCEDGDGPRPCAS